LKISEAKCNQFVTGCKLKTSLILASLIFNLISAQITALLKIALNGAAYAEQSGLKNSLWKRGHDLS